MSLHKRVAALEARRNPPGHQALIAAAVQRFHTKFLALVGLQAGREPDAGDSTMVHYAAQFWHDPAGTEARMKADVRAARAARRTDGHA